MFMKLQHSFPFKPGVSRLRQPSRAVWARSEGHRVHDRCAGWKDLGGGDHKRHLSCPRKMSKIVWSAGSRQARSWRRWSPAGRAKAGARTRGAQATSFIIGTARCHESFYQTPFTAEKQGNDYCTERACSAFKSRLLIIGRTDASAV